MKKLLALVMSLALILTAVIVPFTVSAQTGFIGTAQISDWDGRFDVAEKGQYLRPKILQNGTVGAAWYVMGEGGKFGISTDGGVTYGNVVQVVSNGWDNTEEERLNGTFNRGRLEVQNPNFVEMENGDLLYTYRYNTYTSEPDSIKSWDKYYTSIRYQISTDGGKNWSEPAIIAEKEFDDPDNEEGHAGYWEPEPIYINGELYVYWCDTVTGKPDFSFQHVRGAKWNGTGFDASFIAVNGQTNQSREGMCVITELSDGSYAMIIESTDTDDNTATHNDCGSFLCSNDDEDGLTFVIKIARSKDGVNWTKPVTVAKPDKLVSDDMTDKNGALAVCASPYIITLPDGRLAISYQTSDLYKGDVIPNAVVRRSVVQVAISDIAVGYDTAISTANFKKIAESPANLVDNQYANAGSLLYSNGKLLAYTYIGTNTQNEDGTVTSASSGLKGAYINLEEKQGTFTAGSIDDYAIFNSGKKDVTLDENGGFVLPTGTTNMIYGDSKLVSEDAKFGVDISYDAADYTSHGQSGYAFSTDAENKTLNFTAGKQAKAMFNYVADAKMLDMDVTMQGNTAGTIWGGVAFHLQESDYTSGAFNTAGYSVYLVRSSSTLNKLTLYVRYCTEGGKDAKTYQPVLTSTELPTNKDLKLRLQVSVGETHFTIKALSADGNTQYGTTKTYELDHTATISATKYYETGKVGLVVNGAHTFSNISITRTTTEVETAYNADNYTTYGQSGYGFTADAENKTLNFTASKQSKAMFNYVGEAKLPYFDITMQGNSAGTIWGGVAFHIQESDFTSGAFNTAGYSVYLVRSSSTLNKLTLTVRYCTEGGAKAYDYAPVLTTELPTDIDLKLRLQVAVDETTFTVKALSADGNTQYGETKTYKLDDTAANTTTPSKYYETGKIALITNGIHTFSNINITNRTPIVRDDTFVKTANLDASAEFTFEDVLDGGNQVGFDLRVQDAADTSPGLTGYAVKLDQKPTYEAGTVLLQLTRYGTTSAGVVNKNLGNMETFTDTTVLGGNTPDGATIIMSAKVRENILTVTLTNKADSSLTSTYEFDLTTPSGSYNNYYEDGGFGFFKNGNDTITISNAKFALVPKSVEALDTSLFTVYAPEESESVTLGDRKIINNDATAKKIILNDALVTDFNADATFEVGNDGNFKGGIIFRAQNVGNETDAMEGYSVVIWKNAHTTGNNGRIVLLLYKWGRDAEGNMKYLGEVGRLVDTTTFNAVHPDAQNSILDSAGKHIKLNVAVKGTAVTASFDVLNDENIVAASSEEAVFNLNAKTFAAEADNTLYNYGAVGVSLSTKGALCDFNVEKSDYYEFSDINGYEQHSSNANEFVVDQANNKIYSISAGYKQAVLTGKNFSDFEAGATLKSTSAGEQYNMGFDFHITSTSDTASNMGGFEGYRAVVVRNQNTHANPDGTVLYIFKFTKKEDGTYTREQVASNSHADFFADYTTEDTTDKEYGNVEVDLKVVVKDGKLTATATMCEYPDKVITVTADGFDGQGQVGWFVYQGGSFTGLSVKAPVENAVITAADSENGFVYAAVNSGAAKDGDKVKIVPVGADGYVADEVSYTVNGVKTVVEAVDGEYVFDKTFGATEIAATFKAIEVGDIDGNGVVNGEDLIRLRKILLRVYDEAYEEYAADCTGDGNIDVCDLIALKEIVGAIA